MKPSCKCCQYTDCPWKAYVKRCPCPKCLVKVVCESPCDDFIDFRRYNENQHRLQLLETWI